MASLNDERDNLIDPFVQKAEATGSHLTVDEKPREDNEEEAGCKPHYPDSLHAENIHIPNFPCEENNNYHNEGVLSKLQCMNDRLELIIAMIMRDPTRRTDPLEANIDDNSIKFDHCDYRDTGSYMTLPTQNNDSDCNEDDAIEMVSPHPMPV
ncbi:hypothetical protein PanWU01x14_163220 [Parasponia andersonii]|uniref:Uncharacterized protein n=1 Tax=Parasponia andersonii TaxID=3476 RepID=A0A2P5CCR5_PARAD|nr:hypothetical protein PanWU01x14_163220 [Parasponia andersonii]